MYFSLSLSLRSTKRGSSFSPLALSPALWLDASDASTITLNGGSVNQWKDKSERSFHLSQTTATNQPTYIANSINTRAAVSLDGVNDFMSVSANPFFTQAARSAFSVIRYRNATTGLQSVYATDITATAPAMYLQADAGTIKGYNGGYVSGGAYTANSVQMVGLQELSGGVGFRVYRNGSLSASGPAAVATNNNGFSIGRLGTGVFGAFAAVDMGEIIAINGDISTENRQLLEGYLAHKWGLTASLPANHPYKTARPTV